uniref:Uncharacterized protein n=1 Tax=Parastrongyloides trichosuri TaxID=131310 RepID=A0A0N4ZNL0_PARTI
MHEQVLGTTTIHRMTPEEYNFTQKLPNCHNDNGGFHQSNMLFNNTSENTFNKLRINTIENIINNENYCINKEQIDGFIFDPSRGNIISHFTIPRGTIFQDLPPRLAIEFVTRYYEYLKYCQKKPMGKIMIKKSIDGIDVYGVVDYGMEKTLPLNTIETQLLAGVYDLEERIKLLLNRERMDFLQDLIIGSECIAEIKNKFFKVKIESKTSDISQNGKGIIFEVSIEASFIVIHLLNKKMLF